MASNKDEHLAKVAENLKVLQSLDSSLEGAIGWSITILFYSALHFIEAYFESRRGFGCKHHFSRASEIQRDEVIKSLFGDYSTLETLSREARYDVSEFGAEDLKRAEACFENIRKAVEALV